MTRTTQLNASPSSDLSTLKPQDKIEGLVRGLTILELFNEAQARLSAQQAGDLSGISRTAARRQLLTLAHLGYLTTDGKLFWLTPKVLRLAQSFIDSSRLARIVQPYLQRAAAGLQETVYFCVLDGEQVIYLARQGPSRSNASGYGVGEQISAPLTAAGLILLSYLSAAEQKTFIANYRVRNFTPYTLSDPAELAAAIQAPRQQGYALSERQLDVHYRGIAVPVLDHRGLIHGALSVTPPLANEPLEVAVKRVLPTLHETAYSLRKLI